MKKIVYFLSVLLTAVLLLFGLTPDSANARESVRISGADRYDTAVQTSKAGWPNGATTAIIARGDLYPDALAGAPLAYKKNAPILLSQSTDLNELTKKELTRLKVKNVILLGGKSALSDKVKKQIENMGITVNRVSGSNRYDTALEIAKELNPVKNEAILATGFNFPDALAVAPYAAEKGVPILLTDSKTIATNVFDYAKQFKTVTLIGGKAAIDPTIEKKFTNKTRISGTDRYETAAKIVRELYSENNKIYISTGANFPDALTGSVLAAKNKTGILLTQKSFVPPSAEIVFPQQQVKSFQVFGGTGVVEDKVITAFQKLVVQFEDSIGGGQVADKAKFISNAEAEKFEANTTAVKVETNGSQTYTIKNASQFTYKKDDLLFFPTNDDNPTGKIAKVLKAEKQSNGSLKLQLGQPAIEDVFPDLNFTMDQPLTTDKLVDMKLQDGVSLQVGNQQINSMEQFNQLKGNNFLAENTLMKLFFDLNLGEMLTKKTNPDGGTGSENDEDFIVGETKKELNLTGSFEINNVTPKAQVKRSAILKRWKSFNYGVSYESTVKADLTGSVKGSFGLKNKQRYSIGDDDSWVKLEGVKRDNRLSLASFTFVPGPVTVVGKGTGNNGYKQVPIGITLFITTTLEGKFNVDAHIGYVKTDKTNIGIKWDNKTDKINPYRTITPKKNELNADVTGAIAVTKKYGADLALNVGGLLPAVLENDFVIANSAKGEGYLKLNLLNNTIEKDGCVTNDFKIGLQSVAKYRLAAKAFDVEIGREGELPLAELSIYKKKHEYCVNSGTLKGDVKDAVTDQPIKDVKVTIYKDNLPVKTLKTDSDGKYEVKLFNGTYGIAFTKNGYTTLSYSNVEIDSNQVKYNPKMRLLSDDYVTSPGTVGGIVSNAVNGQDLEGVTVNLRKGHNTKTGTIHKTLTTDEYGEYVFENLQAGYYTAEVKKAGFTTTYIDVVAIGGEESLNNHATLRPILADDEISIVLTWGATPNDLDSHLTGPSMGDDSRFHIYYARKTYSHNSELIAQLDHDDTSSYGPETVTILKQNAGTYSYYVHNYSNRYDASSTTLSNSGAKVEVYFGDRLVRTFYVPTNLPGTVWKVFDLSGTTITPVNQILETSTSIQSANNQNVMIEPEVLESFNEDKTVQ